MFQKSSILIVLVLVFCVFFVPSFCQEETAQQTTEGNEPTEGSEGYEEIVIEEKSNELFPSLDVETNYIFPDIEVDKEFPTGEVIEVILSFTNTGDDTFNITGMHSALMYPQDYRYVIQNFSRAEFRILVGAYEQVSISYYFATDPMIEPREFGYVATVDYHDLELNRYQSVFFNDTILLVEPPSDLDVQEIFSYVGGFALAGLGIFVASKLFGSQPKKTTKTTQEFGTKNTTNTVHDDDWLSGHKAILKTTSKKKGSAKSPKSRKQ